MIFFCFFRMFICSICNLYRASTFSSVLRHIGLIHRYDPGLHICCGIDHCPQTYTNYESRVYRKHRNALHSSSSSHGNGSGETTDAATALIQDGDAATALIQDGEFFPEPLAPDIRTSGARCILKMREEYHIPQSTLNKIIVDLEGLWTLSMNSVKERLEEQLRLESPVSVNDCFGDNFPFADLKTEYMQVEYYKQYFNFLVSYFEGHNVSL